MMKICYGAPKTTATCVQLASMMISVGSALVPQIVKPFLGDHRHLSNRETHINCTNDTSGVPLRTDAGQNIQESGQIQYGFLTVACINVFLGLVTVVLYCLLGGCSGIFVNDKFILEGKPLHDTKSSQSKKMHPDNEKCFTITLCLLIFINFMFSGGRANMFNQLLYTYVNEYLLWTVGEGTLLVTTFQVIKIVTVIIVALLSKWTKLFPLMIFDNLFLLIGSLILVLLVEESKIVVWVGFGLCAVGLSNINATTMAFINELTPPSGRITGLMLSAAALGKIVFSTLAGVLMGESPRVFPAALTGLSSVLNLLLVAWFLMRRFKTRASSTGYEEITTTKEETQNETSHLL